jgi:hypothetical protein
VTGVDLLKTALTALGTAVLSMLGWWFVHLQNLPDRDEVRTMIATDNPYLEDRKLLLNRIDNLTDTTKELDQSVRELQQQIARLSVGKVGHAFQAQTSE